MAHTFQFDNAFVRDLPGDSETRSWPRQVHALYSRVQPTPVESPRLIAHSPEMVSTLGIDPAFVASPDFAPVFGGNVLMDGMEPYAANYGGHQFGIWAGQLGDGRAITLGEVINRAGERWELQLKGAGPTPYSRSADGRAVLRSSVREFLCSEAMHHLGVPTTRALSVVTTGEEIVRDMFYDGNPQVEPGAIVCRAAPSFVRFGNFELLASRGQSELLGRLVEFTIRRDFPDLVASLGDADPDRLKAEWFAVVCERTAHMIAEWMRVGFVHGVMNTDNMSILGLTIDYGPYGWIDNFDLEWTPNTTDAAGRRYRFGHQPTIAYWNLGRFANALAPVFASLDPLHAGLERYVHAFSCANGRNLARKLGLAEYRDADLDLVQDLHTLLQRAEVDMTIFFRRLADVDVTAHDRRSLDVVADAFYDREKMLAAEPELERWIERYAHRVRMDALDPRERRTVMQSANPRYVLRNYLAQLAIDRAERGDYAGITELLDVLRHPYEDQAGADALAGRRPDWARHRAGCSMLSCSS